MSSVKETMDGDRGTNLRRSYFDCVNWWPNWQLGFKKNRALSELTEQQEVITQSGSQIAQILPLTVDGERIMKESFTNSLKSTRILITSDMEPHLPHGTWKTGEDEDTTNPDTF